MQEHQKCRYLVTFYSLVLHWQLQQPSVFVNILLVKLSSLFTEIDMFREDYFMPHNRQKQFVTFLSTLFQLNETLLMVRTLIDEEGK